MEQHTVHTDAMPSPREPEIAIIGMSGRFPGADDVHDFWRNISNGVESFTQFTDEDLLLAGEDPKVFNNPDYVRSRPILNDIRGFDASFFGVSPREATLADPQQLIFTECVWEALEASGYGTPEGRGTVGVFAGMNISTYLLTRPNAFQLSVEIDGLMAGNDKDALATNVSYRLDLRGPSLTVQTFCSTSLVAVHLACASLRREECDVALAGGVSIRVPDRTGYLYHEGNQASPDGHVRTFDADAHGSMFGDGVAVVALKRLDQAIADHDTVLAVIRGSAINNDGALKFSYQAPSLDGQRRCVTSAIANAGVRPSDISYVEAHGTATEVGDPMEVAALTSAFGATADKQYCLLGSVKPNVGHLDRASGVTGLIKVVQSLQHELIPGTLNFQTPNPEIDFDNSPFRVTAQPTAWPRTAERPRVAGLSSLGTGGTNAHAIITESPTSPVRATRSRRWQVLPISARSAAALEQARDRLAQRLEGSSDLDLGDVAYTLQVGRKVFSHRKVLLADTVTGAVTGLGDPTRLLGRVDGTAGRKVGLLIAGVGEQYPGMVAQLYADEPEFRAEVDECVAILGLTNPAQLSDVFTDSAQPSGAGDLARMLGREGPQAARQPTPDAHLIQPAVFVAEYALARQLMRWGLQPELMLGYSLGEYVAACLSGVLSLPDALSLVAYRAKLIASLPEGAMLAVAADEVRLRAVLGSGFDELDVAIRTGSQLVLAGPIEAVDAAAQKLLTAEISCQRLQTSHAFHSRMLAPAAAELVGWIADNITLNAPRIDYLSNVTGQLATEALVTDPEYWAKHMCQTVEFGAGLANLLAAGEFALVEIGPGQTLGALTRGHPDCKQSQWPLILRTLPGAADRGNSLLSLTEAVARLWLTGVPIDWASLHGIGQKGSEAAELWQPGRVPLPTYPFEHQDHWLEAEPTTGPTAAGPNFDADDAVSVLNALPLLPDTEWISVPLWRQSTPRPPRAEAARWLVFTDDGVADAIADTLRKQLESTGAQVVFARPGERFSVSGDGIVLRPGSPQDATAALLHLTESQLAPQHVVHLWTAQDGEAGGPDATARTLERGLHTLVAFARAAGDIGLEPWLLDVVSIGSHRVLPGDEVLPERATVLGPCRLIPVEYPKVQTRLIDIDLATATSSPVALLAELRAEPADQVVALRGGRRWVPEYEVLDAASATDPAAAVRVRQGGSYLVTGGLGGIGLAMAERLAADYQARLVLLGRTPVPPQEQWSAILASPNTAAEVRRRLEGLQRLHSYGVEVITVAGDVSNLADVKGAVDAAVQRFGRLDGVLHCAGVPAAGLMQFKTASDIAKVLAPKVAGSLAIAEAVRGLSLDFIALFSSTTSVTGGGAGQVDYCAANAYLDAFAQSEPIPGCLVSAIDWGEWTWNGWTTGLENYDEGSIQFFQDYRARFGVSFDDGWQTLQRVLAAGQTHVVISTQDFPTLVKMSRRSSIASHSATVKKARDALGRSPRPELSTSYVEPQSVAEQAIAGVWGEALGLEQVGVHDNFFELGGNSLIGMEIIAEVRKALEIAYLPPHLLYEAPTVAALAAAATAGQETDDQQDPQATQADDQQRSRIEQRRSTLRSRRMP
ncbi:MAG TPA: SDR family NAD(P)-dependent oxidoreductase [Jatrophihabitans sp.]|jgi:acyl transferase domain-containing protein|uniref:type I polyketide synthase n=1 Tax=Jatrophihabitans sp. TaxID=1932789 RepID=UPI002F064DDD